MGGCEDESDGAEGACHAMKAQATFSPRLPLQSHTNVTGTQDPTQAVLHVRR
jgi:hypothetical protein